MGLFGCDYLETIGTFFPEYRCKYSRQTLSTHTAQDICMSSRYIDCADYKNAARCFITSAVCLTMGKPDNCEELCLMRFFRDEWLRRQPYGETMVEEYYQIAPQIVKKIDQQPNARSIYADIYQNYIVPCVSKIKERLFAESERIYIEMVNTLKNKYCR